MVEDRTEAVCRPRHLTSRHTPDRSASTTACSSEGRATAGTRSPHAGSPSTTHHDAGRVCAGSAVSCRPLTHSRNHHDRPLSCGNAVRILPHPVPRFEPRPVHQVRHCANRFRFGGFRGSPGGVVGTGTLKTGMTWSSSVSRISAISCSTVALRSAEVPWVMTYARYSRIRSRVAGDGGAGSSSIASVISSRRTVRASISVRSSRSLASAFHQRVAGGDTRERESAF